MIRMVGCKTLTRHLVIASKNYYNTRLQCINLNSLQYSNVMQFCKCMCRFGFLETFYRSSTVFLKLENFWTTSYRNFLLPLCDSSSSSAICPEVHKIVQSHYYSCSITIKASTLSYNWKSWLTTTVLVLLVLLYFIYKFINHKMSLLQCS